MENLTANEKIKLMIALRITFDATGNTIEDYKLIISISEKLKLSDYFINGLKKDLKLWSQLENNIMKKQNFDMKPIGDLMDRSIDKLNKLIPSDCQMKCNTCGQIMDLRDLSQVFAHEDCNGIPIDYKTMEQIPYSSSKKVGSSIEWTKNKNPINLN